MQNGPDNLPEYLIPLISSISQGLGGQRIRHGKYEWDELNQLTKEYNAFIRAQTPENANALKIALARCEKEKIKFPYQKINLELEKIMGSQGVSIIRKNKP